MDKDLVVVSKANLPELFQKDGCEPLLKKIKEEIDSFVPDITTIKGRNDVKSFAYKVARTKTLIDDCGKEFASEMKEKIKLIDGERKRVKDTLTEWAKKVRLPVTDWEEKEKERIRKIQDNIFYIKNVREMGFETSDQVTKQLKDIEKLEVDESYAEFKEEAQHEKNSSILQLDAQFIVLQKKEEDKAEAERLEKERLAKEAKELKEQKAKEQKEREDRIAREAAEKAKKEAEEKAQKEKEKAARLAKEELEKAEREKLEAQLAKEKAEREKREATEKAEQDKQDAIQAEKDRQEKEKQKAIDEENERQTNKKHRNKILSEAVADIEAWHVANAKLGISDDQTDSLSLINYIIENKIRHIKVIF